MSTRKSRSARSSQPGPRGVAQWVRLAHVNLHRAALYCRKKARRRQEEILARRRVVRQRRPREKEGAFVIENLWIERFDLSR